MPRSRRQRLQARLFDTAFEVLGRAVRRPVLRSVVPRALAWTGRLVGRARGFDTTAPDREAIAREWQRMMPNPKVVPIVAVQGDTVIAEITIRCPLRGTGDVDACYRMMAYDRGMLARAGTGFEVLESQATPGVERCRVRLGPVNAWQPGTRSARG